MRKTLRLRIDLLPERINNKRERGTFGMATILLPMTQHFALQGLQIPVTAFYYPISMVVVSVGMWGHVTCGCLCLDH